MPRKDPKLVEDFLIPALETEQFPHVLWWENREQQIFQLKWNHKSSAQWTEEDSAVFTEWDKKKGRYLPGNQAYLMCAKQRFRSALYKLQTIKRLKSTDRTIKRFCIVNRIIHSTRRRRATGRTTERIQEIPNSPLSPNNEIVSIYSDTPGAGQLSPGGSSSASEWESEERGNHIPNDMLQMSVPACAGVAGVTIASFPAEKRLVLTTPPHLEGNLWQSNQNRDSYDSVIPLGVQNLENFFIMNTNFQEVQGLCLLHQPLASCTSELCTSGLYYVPVPNAPLPDNSFPVNEVIATQPDLPEPCVFSKDEMLPDFLETSLDLDVYLGCMGEIPAL